MRIIAVRAAIDLLRKRGEQAAPALAEERIVDAGSTALETSYREAEYGRW